MELAESLPNRKFSLQLDHIGFGLVLIGLGGFGYLALRDPTVAEALAEARGLAETVGATELGKTASKGTEEAGVGEYFQEIQAMNLRVEALAGKIQSAWMQSDLEALASTSSNPGRIRAHVDSWLLQKHLSALPPIQSARSKKDAQTGLACIVVQTSAGQVELVFNPQSVPAELVDFRVTAENVEPPSKH